MNQPTRMIASLVALGAGAALLVADAPPPECGSYEGFDLTLQYTTDCVESFSPMGNLVLSAASHNVREEGLVTVQTTGPLEVQSASGWWVCTAEGPGRISSIGFQITQVTQAEDGSTVRTNVGCHGFSMEGGTQQTVECTAPGDPEAGCSLMLTMPE